jgi:hypothetical protein
MFGEFCKAIAFCHGTEDVLSRDSPILVTEAARFCHDDRVDWQQPKQTNRQPKRLAKEKRMTRQYNPVQPTVVVAHHQHTARQLRSDYLAHQCSQGWQRLAALGRRIGK